jgi:hypothetical protein
MTRRPWIKNTCSSCFAFTPIWSVQQLQIATHIPGHPIPNVERLTDTNHSFSTCFSCNQFIVPTILTSSEQIIVERDYQPRNSGLQHTNIYIRNSIFFHCGVAARYYQGLALQMRNKFITVFIFNVTRLPVRVISFKLNLCSSRSYVRQPLTRKPIARGLESQHNGYRFNERV